MEFTQQQVLAILEKSGRNSWNLRQMTALRKEGFLPPLVRKTQLGTKKPLYVWNETDIDQIVEVYDWWDYCNGDRVTLTLILWLQGYDITLDPLRNFYIKTIKIYFQKLTHGEADPDEILQVVSEIVFLYMRKMRYTPGLADQRKKMESKQNFSMEQMEMFIEKLLSGLVVPNQEFGAEEELENVSTDSLENEKVFVELEDVAAFLRDIFSLPNLRDVATSATIDQWNQAREDFQFIGQLFREFYALSSNPDNSPFPEALVTHLTLLAAVWLLVPLLSARCRGYDQWIDRAFEKIHELLSNPEYQAQIRAKHQSRDTIVEADQDEEM